MSSTRLGGFDSLAGIYDVLAKLVFGKSIRKAQLYFLGEIKNASSVLILGGGTGWILEALLKINRDCEVWYVDASRKMIERAQIRIGKNAGSVVHFIHGTEENLPMHVKHDAVIANFYFDMFSDGTLSEVVKKISRSLLPDSKLLVSDFVQNRTWWQSVLLSAMYFFFRVVCNIEAFRLTDWEACLYEQAFSRKESRYFYAKFIKSSIFQFRGGM